MTALAAPHCGSDDAGGVNALVLQHLAMCQRAARKFHRAYNDLDDLVQVARVGLIKAAKRHDATLGPFVPYAWQAIIGELMHYVRDHESIVRPPRCATREERLAITRYLPFPTDDDVAREVAVVHEPGFSLTWVREALARLPWREREIVLGVVLSGFTQTEIGAELGVSQSHVSKLMRKALRQLRFEAAA